MKKIIIIVASALVLIIAVFAILKFTKININNPFREKPITINSTANIVEEMRSLAEFTTAVYYQDVVITKARQQTIFGKAIKGLDDELVLITKGKVRIGFDMSSLTDNDIVLDSNSIMIRLPKVKILDIITNPSDFETFEESGEWSFDDVNKYKKEARAKLEANTIGSGIMELAEKTGKEKLTSLLNALGFKEVDIQLEK